MTTPEDPFAPPPSGAQGAGGPAATPPGSQQPDDGRASPTEVGDGQGRPAWDQPGYEQPSQTAAYGQRGYGQPPSQTAAYGAPPSQTAAYGAPPSQTAAYGQPAYGQPAYGQPGHEQAGYGPSAYGPAPGGWNTAPSAGETEGLAVAALVCAIISFVLFPLVPAVVALVLAGRASDRIRASGDRRGGVGLVTAAKVLAWINLALCGVVLLVLLLAVGLFAAPGIR